MLKSSKSILLLIVLLSAPLTVGAADLGDDIPGASDYPGLERFVRSRIVGYEQVKGEEYRLALGTLKKINSVLVPEYENRIEGELTRITYRIPDGERSEKVFQYFNDQLKKLSANYLFECHGRGCGSSNHWANRIFNIATLYGPDRYQHYLAASANIGGREVVVIVYSIQRGNRRLYAQLDIIETHAEALRAVEANPETLLNQLKKDGYLVLDNLSFTEEDELSEESAATLVTVAKALLEDLRLPVYLVGHYYGNGGRGKGGDVESLQQKSLLHAQRVRQELINAGVAEERLSAHGVGPLAPANRREQGADRVELVIKNL